MAQDNLALVRRLYEAVSATRRIPPELFAADFEFDASAISAEHPDVAIGAAAAEALLREYWNTFDDFRIELEEVRENTADRIVTVIRDEGRVRGSDARITNRYVHIFEFRDGKIARQQVRQAGDRDG